MAGPSMKNSTETSRQRIEWCWAPIRTIMGGHHHRIDTFPCAETPTSRRGLMDSILNAATRGIISRGSKLFVTIAASLATAPLVRLLVHRGRSRRFDMIEYAA